MQDNESIKIMQDIRDNLIIGSWSISAEQIQEQGKKLEEVIKKEKQKQKDEERNRQKGIITVESSSVRFATQVLKDILKCQSLEQVEAQEKTLIRDRIKANGGMRNYIEKGVSAGQKAMSLISKN